MKLNNLTQGVFCLSLSRAKPSSGFQEYVKRHQYESGPGATTCQVHFIRQQTYWALWLIFQKHNPTHHHHHHQQQQHGKGMILFSCFSP